MTDYERRQLEEELEILKILLDFHVKNKERISMPPDEFEAYVNAGLDRFSEIKFLLKSPMTKYKTVHDLVARLTSNPAFKTFFTIYLMAETTAQREKIETDFWKELDGLPKDEQQLMTAEFTRTFLQIPILLEQMKARLSGGRIAA